MPGVAKSLNDVGGTWYQTSHGTISLLSVPGSFLLSPKFLQLPIPAMITGLRILNDPIIANC